MTSGTCKCAGLTTSFGGSNCNDKLFNGKPFCYVQPGTCSDGAMLTAKYGVAAKGMEWSYKVCDGSGSMVIGKAPEVGLDGNVNLAAWSDGAWEVKTDAVMRGSSTAAMAISPDKKLATFSGNINLRKGGFASVEKRFPETDLSTFEGVWVEFDNLPAGAQPLALSLQLNDGTQKWGFSSPFAVPIGGSTTSRSSMFLPMSSFILPIYRSKCPYLARIYESDSTNSVLDRKRVSGVSLHVTYQAGDFNVNIHSIKAIQNNAPADTPVPVISLTDKAAEKLTENTIQRGSVLWDRGYQSQSTVLYAATTKTLSSAGKTEMASQLRVRGETAKTEMAMTNAKRTKSRGSSSGSSSGKDLTLYIAIGVVAFVCLVLGVLIRSKLIRCRSEKGGDQKAKAEGVVGVSVLAMAGQYAGDGSIPIAKSIPASPMPVKADQVANSLVYVGN